MKHKRLKLIASCMAVLFIFISSGGAYAAEGSSAKEEVVYALLDSSGSPESVYIVNIFDGVRDITDYGDYAEVKNLTVNDDINVAGDAITVHTDADKYYYQGNMSSFELPWNICIRYELDGENIPAEELSGKNGALAIYMDIEKNTEQTRGFYDNFALQAAVTLDTGICGNIVAEGATVANAGTDKQLSYIILPGKGANIKITADVRDFYMDPISVNGVQLALNVDMDTDELDIDGFSDDMAQFEDGIGQLSDGASLMDGGLLAIADGMKMISDVSSLLNDGMGEMNGGVNELAAGMGELSEGLGELAGGGSVLYSASQDIADGMLEMVNMQLKTSMGSSAPTLTWDNYSSVLSAMIGITDDMRSQAKAEIASNAGGLSGVQLDALLILSANALGTNEATAANCNAAIAAAGSRMNTSASASQEIQTVLTKIAAAGDVLQVASVNNVMTAAVAQQQQIQESAVTDEMRFAYYTAVTSAITGATDEQKAIIMVIACDKVIASGGTVELVSAIADAAAMLKTVSAVNDAVLAAQNGSGTDDINAFLNQVVIANNPSFVSDMTALLESLSGIQQFVSQLKLYTDGVSSTAAGVGEMNAGIPELKEGMNELSLGMSSVADGAAAIYVSLDKLAEGASQLAAGMDGLVRETAGMDGTMKEKISEKIDEIMTDYTGGDYVLESFASDKNTDVGGLQFVMKADGVVRAEAETVSAETEENTGFWERFLKLFGIN